MSVVEVTRDYARLAPLPALTGTPHWRDASELERTRLRSLRREHGRRQHRDAPLSGRRAEKRLLEHNALAHALAIPEDHFAPSDRNLWRLFAELSPSLANVTDARYNRSLEVLRFLALTAERGRGGVWTTSPGHAALGARLGVSPLTIQRYINDWIAAGFLARLCTGRSAGRPHTNGEARRARYILTAPGTALGYSETLTIAHYRLTQDPKLTLDDVMSPVDNRDTPPNVSEYLNLHDIASSERQASTESLRDSESTTDGPLRGPEPRALAKRRQFDEKLPRRKAPESTVAFADSLRSTHAFFRSLSRSAVVIEISRLPLDRWGVDDVIEAFHTGPDGKQWGYRDMTGSGWTAGLLRYRLAPWVADPAQRSPSEIHMLLWERDEAARKRRAREQAERRRKDQELVEKVRPGGPEHEAYEASVAAAFAAIGKEPPTRKTFADTPAAQELLATMGRLTQHRDRLQARFNDYLAGKTANFQPRRHIPQLDSINRKLHEVERRYDQLEARHRRGR